MMEASARRGVARLGVVVLAVCACGPRGGGDAGEDSTGSDSSGPGESESGESGSTDDASTDTESTGEPDVPPDLPGVDPCDDAPTPGDERTVWVEEFDGGEDVSVVEVLPGVQGEMFVVANAEVAGQPSVLIAAHDANDGGVAWTKTTPVDGLHLARAAAVMPSGDFIVVGETEPFEVSDAWVGRFDGSGDFVWDITVDAPTTDESDVSDWASDVLVTPTGTIYVLAGSRWGDDVQQAASILEISGDGGEATLVWDDVDEACELPMFFSSAGDGGFLLGSYAPLLAPPLSRDGCTKRVGSNGVLEWTEDVGFPNMDLVLRVFELADSSLMWVGIQADVEDVLHYRTSVGGISGDGQAQWASVIGFCDGDQVISAERYGDGLVIAEGAWRGSNNALAADGVLRVVDAAGETQSFDALPNLGAGPPRALAVDLSGAVYVAGRVFDPSNDYFVARIDL